MSHFAYRLCGVVKSIGDEARQRERSERERDPERMREHAQHVFPLTRVHFEYE